MLGKRLVDIALGLHRTRLYTTGCAGRRQQGSVSKLLKKLKLKPVTNGSICGSISIREPSITIQSSFAKQTIRTLKILKAGDTVNPLLSNHKEFKEKVEFEKKDRNSEEEQFGVPASSEDSSSTPKSKENIWTIPNALCYLRIGMTPVIGHMIVHSQYGPAIGLLVVAGVTDVLDGWIARVVPGQSTVMGSFLDPMADKILVGTLFLSLTYVDLIPVPLTALIVGRDAILIAAGFYIRFLSLDPPKTLKRYFDVTHPTAQLAPALISKVNTGLQLTLVGATLASTVVSSIDLHPYLQVLWYSTAVTTVASAVYYCFAKDTVKILRQTSSRLKSKVKTK